MSSTTAGTHRRERSSSRRPKSRTSSSHRSVAGAFPLQVYDYDEAAQAVTLNVGGQNFKTTSSTLRKYPSTYFSGLFSGKYQIKKQRDGTIFIDRDGTHFRLLLNFMRSGQIVFPKDLDERRELMIEAEFYCLKDVILAAEREEMRRITNEDRGGYWEDNLIFIGKENIDFEDDQQLKDETQTECLKNVQCPDTTELVWKSIHDVGLTVIFQICHPSTAQNTDFSLKNLKLLLSKVAAWKRPFLRFVFVYDAGLTRELLKLSNEKFNNSSYVWYFSKGKLIECTLQWKLKYVGENIWKHYYTSIHKDEQISSSNL